MPLNPLLKELREELYLEPYSVINFSQHRGTIAPTDIKRPMSQIMSVMNRVLRLWESYVRPTWIHELANKAVRDLVRREDDNTSYNCIAPVSKAFHMAVVHFADGDDRTAVSLHKEKITTYISQIADGMTSGGTNGVQLWDTAFTVIAVAEAGLARAPEYKSSMQKALEFLEVSQIRDDLADPYRQKRKGGWTFSTRDQGYIVSDCSAEAMKATIMLQEEWSDLS
jgi:lanosterol synthase